MLKNVIKEMEAASINVISKAKASLNKSNSSGNLSNSLTSKIEGKTTQEPKLTFYAEDYGKFVDEGVQGYDPGAMPSGSLARYNKAPGSPYKFGSGNSSGGSLRSSIDKWVVQKGIPNVRDAKGRFIKRKSMVYLITRSIWNTGIKPTYFFTNAIDSEIKGINKKLTFAYTKDLRDGLEKDVKQKGLKYKRR
jgi:hypothetical protein